MRINRQVIFSDGFLDKSGITVSWLCAAHCVILPLAAAAFPFLGLGFLTGENVEWVIIFASALLALASLLPAYLHHHRKFHVLLLFFSGFGFLVFARLFLEENPSWNIPFILAGAIFISAAHLFNFRLCRKCRECCEIQAEN